MIAFIIKSGICMVLLFGLYWMILRKEKLFIFNRYYLIFSVLFSLTIPFISFSPNLNYNKATSDILTILNNPPELNPVQNVVASSSQEIALSGNSESGSLAQAAAVKTRTMDSKRILLFIYLSGFALMLIRFCRNILLISMMFRRSEKTDHEWYKIALFDHPVNPFSFLRTVYINKQDYLENRIAVNVLRHELEHVRQSHSYDIIFFEVFHIVFWFNPMLFLYKWAARINHEYLADEAVIRSISDMRTYANELINFIYNRVSVPFTSGFSPSMIRLRLLMMNTNTSRWGKNIRMLITLFISVLLMSILSIRPAYPDTQDSKIKKGSANNNEDIVIEEVYFRGTDFKSLKALFVIDGRKLGSDEMITVDLQQIKTIDILKGRKAIRKYGRSAKDGVFEISTYEIDKKSVPDSLYFKPIYTVNDKVPEGTITIPVSNLFSLSIWTYPIFPNQDLSKRWRTIGIMTRDFYSIRGKIVQKNGEPLPGVMVSATDNPSKVITDKDGRFLVDNVRTGVMAELSAEGYEPLNFKVTDKVFKSDLTIILDRKNESEPKKNNFPISYNIEDFSGKWKFNKELSKSFLPKGTEYVYEIHQNYSDSIMMSSTLIPEDKKEYKSIKWYIFNTVKSVIDETSAIKSLLSCSIGPDGQSFSVTTQMRSIIGLFKEYKRIETFSLNIDEKQLIIRTYDFPDMSSVTGKEIQKMVFDKI